MQRCLICGDFGLVRSSANQMRTCECVEQRRIELAIHRIKLPKRYADASLANFETKGKDPTILTALLMAQRYIEEYTPDGRNAGLLLFGSVGTGKTLLAAAIVRQLVSTRGASGLFWDFRDLLKTIQHSYSGDGPSSEGKVLRQVIDADVLVLDELGAMRSTDWVGDSIEYILNARYNSDKATIITTNYAFKPPTFLHTKDAIPMDYERRAVSREETLADRIGVRMFSRLAEMCRTYPMQGEDHRQRRAR